LLPAATAVLPNVNRVATSAARLASVIMGELRGDYISNGRAERSSLASYDAQLASRLWDLSSSLAGVPSALA
jgi:hypothetical protein